MAATTNTENLKQQKNIFSLVEEQILAFAWSTNMVKNVKICLQISNKLCDDVLHYWIYILIWIVWSILLINSKQFPQNLYSNSLYIVDIICHFL